MAKSLGEDIRLVMLQFSATNPGFIPECIPRKRGESPEQFIARGSAIKGEQILEPTEGVSCLDFPGDLDEAGLVLVDAFSREIQAGGRTFFAPRFVFVQSKHARPSEYFLGQRDAITAALKQIAAQARWRVKVFLNPFFCEGVLVEGVYALSINCEARDPLFDASGKPILRWKKDGHGDKIGDGPVPIEPKKLLRIEDDEVRVVDAE